MEQQENSFDLDALHMLYARTLHTLREARKALLHRNDVTDEEQLLARIRRREVAEHPAYEQYLGARIIEQTRMQLRADLLAQSKAESQSAGTVAIHLAFQHLLEAHYGNRLAEPVRMAQDALLLSFDTGLMMEVRFYSTEEYCLRWSWGEAKLCIDTAPVHPGIHSAPAHLHCDDGSIVAWHMASATPDGCWENFSALLERLLKDPLLEDLDLGAQAIDESSEAGH
ncbi:hypothetical protein Q8A64_17600 [Oxalobacteraceae bacterium R-40]|uniref:Uncharacterized protein n=1 Tax=Keguizhuia sedimenti TaxID=3064264 RepID=A0ABU1BT83_9BURK|nr:hypothetical protein [Oxalobacteraceae bacterium R-40]